MTAFALKPGAILTTERGAPVLVRRWVAEGSYAHVFQGGYGLEGTPCAVKTPKPEPQAVELLDRQADILSRVAGPGIVRLLDRGTAGDAPFLVLEWLEGGSLAELFDSRRRMPLRQALEVAEQVGAALAEFHRQGIPHGDLRGENVVLEGRGAVLIDPHALAVGNVASPSVAADLTAVADLVHRMLSGVKAGEGRLSAPAGYRREVVDFWEQLRDGKMAAADLARSAARIWRLL